MPLMGFVYLPRSSVSSETVHRSRYLQNVNDIKPPTAVFWKPDTPVLISCKTKTNTARAQASGAGPDRAGLAVRRLPVLKRRRSPLSRTPSVLPEWPGHLHGRQGRMTNGLLHDRA